MRIGRWAPRLSRAGGITATATVAAVARARPIVQGGLLELRVLASLLAANARKAGIELDAGLVRTTTVEVYLDPRRRIELRYRGSRAGRALAAHWIRGSVSTPAHADALAEERILAIDGIDLPHLQRQWKMPLRIAQPFV